MNGQKAHSGVFWPQQVGPKWRGKMGCSSSYRSPFYSRDSFSSFHASIHLLLLLCEGEKWVSGLWFGVSESQPLLSFSPVSILWDLISCLSRDFLFCFWASLGSFQLSGHLTFDDCACPLGSSCWTLGILLNREAQWLQWRRRQREFSKAIGTAELRNSALPFMQSEASGGLAFFILGLLFPCQDL